MLFGHPSIRNEDHLQLTTDRLTADTADAGINNIVQRNTHRAMLGKVRTAVVSNLMDHNAKFSIGWYFKRCAASDAEPLRRLR